MEQEKVTEELVRQNGNQAAAVMADFAGGDYSRLKNKPSVNGVTLEGNKTAKQLDLASPIKVKTQMPATGFLPNTMYELGTLQGDTTFLMAPATDSTILNEWHWSFVTPAAAPTITWPAAITAWDGGEVPEIVGNHRYEVSVIGGTAAWIDAI